MENNKKRILVIEGSPRRGGDSDTLSDQFINGAKESGHEVEKIYLNSKNIRGCQGCRACRNNGGVCVIKDDEAEIVEKLIQSDVFVLVSPVYFYSVTAQLKLFMDRTFAREFEIKNKKAYFITTSLAPYVEPYNKRLDIAVETFRGYLSILENIEEGGIIFGAGNAINPDITTNKAFLEAYEMGKKI